MAQPLLSGFLKKSIYPLGWTMVGVIGNAYILRSQLGEVKAGIKEVDKKVDAGNKKLELNARKFESGVQGLKHDGKYLKHDVERLDNGLTDFRGRQIETKRTWDCLCNELQKRLWQKQGKEVGDNSMDSITLLDLRQRH